MYDTQAFRLDQTIRLNYQATPIYYHNYLNDNTFSGYKLQFISFVNKNHFNEADLSSRDITQFQLFNGSSVHFKPELVQRNFSEILMQQKRQSGLMNSGLSFFFSQYLADQTKEVTHNAEASQFTIII